MKGTLILLKSHDTQAAEIKSDTSSIRKSVKDMKDFCDLRVSPVLVQINREHDHTTRDMPTIKKGE
jgi:hypothetical protein